MDEQQKLKLWEKYQKSKESSVKDELIIEYAPLVKFVAGRLSMYLGSNVEFDDLVGYGIFGLIDAIDKFDLDKGIKFETYASLRVRGAILDNIRKMDWIPRSLRKKQKLIDAAIMKLESDPSQELSEELIAKELEITIDEYNKWQNQTKALSLTSLEDYVEKGGETKLESIHHSSFPMPEAVVEKEEIKQLLVKAISELSDKECKVITLYYYEELTLKEISHIMEVTESRISQLHTKALKKMKETLGDHVDLLSAL